MPWQTLILGDAGASCVTPRSESVDYTICKEPIEEQSHGVIAQRRLGV